MPPVPPAPESANPLPGESGPGNPVAPAAAPEQPVRSWRPGDRVKLLRSPRYLKTADPMPMLRPPDLVGIDEIGQVVGVRALGQLAVRFRRGTFLVESEAVTEGEPADG
ncbi:NAD(P)H dehydrogenase assembly family protein [Cyanobium sp. NIES-981]|uniref:NAD(P)H dehydrogenase assembly family protein n=1 Tax=Cyanobium sp. NIES-981 TaxID=1851505 RepID=UPI000B35B83E